MSLDELVTDSLSLADSDRTDWRALQLDDAGRLAIEFSADVPKAKVFIALFDQYGTRLGGASRPGGKISKLAVDVPRGGRYFLMVRAVDGPSTTYSVQVTLGNASTKKNVPAGRPGF